jgi:hypothetical protein
MVVLKYGSLNLLETSGSVQACNGTALPLPLPLQRVHISRKKREYLKGALNDLETNSKKMMMMMTMIIMMMKIKKKKKKKKKRKRKRRISKYCISA